MVAEPVAVNASLMHPAIRQASFALLFSICLAMIKYIVAQRSSMTSRVIIESPMKPEKIITLSMFTTKGQVPQPGVQLPAEAP
eukprot:6998743-Lingulodinium_polyedra.AAC.1